MDKIHIFDTTLRDGAQAAPNTIGELERQTIANSLLELNVDIIEAGFPIASKVDFQTVDYTSKKSEDIIVAALARAKIKDINSAWDALKNARNPRIHTFISTSPIHIKEKIKATPDEVYGMAVNAVDHAMKISEGKAEIQFSAEDATRSDLDFLAKVVQGVIDKGATIINLPDTVGYSQRGEIEHIISYLNRYVPDINKATLSVHNHDDLGQAVSNSLEGIISGARQVECTINGIGERAGNAAMEEILASLITRKDHYGDFDIKTKISRLGSISKLISELFQMPVQYNKAIVGLNAFAHRSGIHQDGVSKSRSTYEIMNPDDWGWDGDNFVLTASSGRNGFKTVLNDLGFNVNEDELNKIYVKGIDHAQRYGHLDSRVIVCMLTDIIRGFEQKYILEDFSVQTDSRFDPVAKVNLKNNGGLIKKTVSDVSGPISSLFRAIDEAIGLEYEMGDNFIIKSLGEGRDAIGETLLTLHYNEKTSHGWGQDKDIIKSAAKAYMSALNKL